MMEMRISDAFHALRLEEIELTADWLMQKQEEKETARSRTLLGTFSRRRKKQLERKELDFARSVEWKRSWLKREHG